MIMPSGKTHCRVYNVRLDKIVYKGIMCRERSETIFDYEDCPYNTGKEIQNVD